MWKETVWEHLDESIDAFFVGRTFCKHCDSFHSGYIYIDICIQVGGIEYE